MMNPVTSLGPTSVRLNSWTTQSQLRLATLFAALLITTACRAQDAAPAASTPDLQPNPQATLAAFEPAADQPYQLGPGDDITITTIGRPELSAKHTIGPDGQITMPLIGSIHIADMTRDQASKAIADALSTYYNGVTVSIAVEHYTSNQVLLLGAVEHPGILTFDKTPTLLEVISRGGVTPDSTSLGGSASSKPAGVPEEVMIYRGSQTMVTVELKALLDEGSPLANMRLKRDDIVYVTGRTRYISILGQVTHPGNMRLQTTSTLSDLLAEAGGPTEKAGRDPHIEIIHRTGLQGHSTMQTLAFSQVMRSKSLDLSLQSGDIIFVAESGFNGAAYTLEKLAPLVNLFTVAAVLTNQ